MTGFSIRKKSDGSFAVWDGRWELGGYPTRESAEEGLKRRLAPKPEVVEEWFYDDTGKLIEFNLLIKETSK
jgi:hypothetical protein